MKILLENIMRKIILNYKIFYFLQSLFKYIPFRIFCKIRTFLYRPFFNKIRKGVLIWDNVIFKFPSDISLGDNVQIA
jgi:acetyltransferase-like isoleucine patch superfamily enzyme